MAALSGLLVVACDDGNGGGDDAGGMHMDGGHTGVDAGGGGGHDAGPGTDSGGGGGEDAGGGGGECAAKASAYCAQFMACSPNGFTGAYESIAICERAVADACESGAMIPLTNGLTDEAACEAAQATDCEGFFSASAPPILPACVPLPGQVTTLMGACFESQQCGVDEGAGRTGRRMYCRPLMTGGTYTTGSVDCPRGQCIPAKAEGSTCNPVNQSLSEFCDTYAGQYCVQQFDATTGVTGGNQCRTVTYGAAGADCFDGSDMQCASGFECDSGSKTCMAALAEGQSCDPLHDLCDSRLGLGCTNEGASGNHCRYGVVFVTVGAQCGPAIMVGTRTENRQCSAYAYCDTTVTPSVCRAKVAEGETCTLSPDNCEPGLRCDATTNTCQVPEPTTSCP